MATIEQSQDTVDTESSYWLSMSERWNMIRDLKGGTWTMRQAGKQWLPKEEAESEKAYQNRIQRSVLYEAYSDTVTKLVSKPFSRPVQVRGDLPEELARIPADVDRTGKDLTSFAAEVFEAMIDFGCSNILVDYPEMDPNATLADKKNNDIRPVFVHVTPQNLIGWRSEGVGANARLTQIRIRECRVEPLGAWSTQEVEYIRVYTPTTWELWKDQGGESGFIKVKEGVNTLGRIPLVTIYARRCGFMESDPALEGLAWLNIAHWQSDSDQRNILSFSRFGLLFGKGFPEDKTIEIGPKRLISTENTDADLKFVEITGAAIQCGERDLRSLEQRMEVLGLQPLVQRQGVETATGKQIHESKMTTAIQAWIRRLEEGFETAYAFAAEWEEKELPKDFEVDIYNDFEIGVRASEDLRLLLDMTLAGKLSTKTFLQEVRRRGVLSEAVNVDDELDSVETEGPPTDPNKVNDGGANGE